MKNKGNFSEVTITSRLYEMAFFSVVSGSKKSTKIRVLQNCNCAHSMNGQISSKLLKPLLFTAGSDTHGYKHSFQSLQVEKKKPNPAYFRRRAVWSILWVSNLNKLSRWWYWRNPTTVKSILTIPAMNCGISEGCVFPYAPTSFANGRITQK